MDSKPNFQVGVNRQYPPFSPLSLGERARVGKDRVHPLRLRPGTWFTGINHGQEVLTMPWNQESPMDQRVKLVSDWLGRRLPVSRPWPSMEQED
jgi:hypothetical protein